MTRKPPPLIVSVYLPGSDGPFWTAIHDPGEQPLIPRIGERIEIDKEWFAVIDVAYYTRTEPTHFREGRIYPGDNPGWRDGIDIAPGITSVTILVKRSTEPDFGTDVKGKST